MTTILHDISKLSLLKRVQELEKRGWECCHKIAEKKNMKKRWEEVKSGRFKTNKYQGVDLTTIYFVKMRKVSK